RGCATGSSSSWAAGPRRRSRSARSPDNRFWERSSPAGAEVGVLGQLQRADRRESRLSAPAPARGGPEMRARFEQWGESLAIRIPDSLTADAGYRRDQEIELLFVEGQLIISPIPVELTLGELLDGVTCENRHPEFETGPATGAEDW